MSSDPTLPVYQMTFHKNSTINHIEQYMTLKSEKREREREREMNNEMNKPFQCSLKVFLHTHTSIMTIKMTLRNNIFLD